LIALAVAALLAPVSAPAGDPPAGAGAGVPALFAPPLAADAREGGAADVRDVAFGQVETSLSLRVRFWGAAKPACVVSGARRICLDGRVVRVNGRRIAATAAHGTVTFSPNDAGLARGAHDWWVETASDRVPDAGTLATRVKVLGRPRCFGAAGRGCHNPRLRGVLTPTPAEAPLVANAPCRLLPRHGVLTPCEFGVARDRAATFALIGDSHAATWRAALEVVAQAERWRGISITRPGCPFSARIPASPDLGPADCRRLQRRTLAYLRARPSIRTIFVSGWAQPPTGPHGGTGGYGGSAAAYAALLDRVPRSVRRIYVLRDNPGTRAGCVHSAGDARRCALPRSRALTPDPLAAVRRPRVRVIDLTSRFCDATRCFPVLGGAYVYKDDNHMNRVFSTTLGPYVLRRLDDA
jgi:SGNH domain-containing protein